ncbi:putative EGF-like domain-containing protein [Megavirus lba]|uniref:Putative EGF-like domain-containing protein n=1 Tax=Megavirus lba TaxID=1235314 RepID=L7Y653_9VIRU|nr:putative EGF-like domain-containing protein [Megavirus lba]
MKISLILIVILCFIAKFIYCLNPNIPAENMSGTMPPELVMAAVVFQNGTLGNYYINSTIIETGYNDNPCPGVNPVQLQNDRLEILKIWVARTNYNRSYILDIYESLATPDTLADGSVNEYLHQFIVAGFASYSANSVAAEYSLQAVDPANIHLFSELDVASINWQADNVSAWYNIITNYSLAGFPGSPVLDGFVNYQYVRFVPCSTEIWIDISNQDPLVATYLAAGESNHNAIEICNIIIPSCTGVNQVYASNESCIEYMSSVVTHQSFCPGGLIANSSGCHYFHALAARDFPEVHCQHVRPYDSPVCQDFCLDQGCGDCDTNAECVFVTGNGKLIPEYQCQCKPGYVGNGTHCTAVSCNISSECPSNYNYGVCTSGLCGCSYSNGFKWVPDVESVSQNNACQCSANETVYWNNGVPECIPIGRCREVWQCPQAATQFTSITCTKYGNNVLIPFNTCLCNYGYDNPGFSHYCQCSSPKREVWSGSRQQTLCLKPTECTQNIDCVSNDCVIPTGEWLGTCA